jgi:membrane fusion protein, multidrug efflux system
MTIAPKTPARFSASALKALSSDILSMRRPILLTSAAVLTAALTLGSLGLISVATKANSQASAAAPAIPVSVAIVQTQSVSNWEDFSGRLEAVERVEIRPRVSGAIKSIHFREGALVKQGDLLVTIDPAPYQAEAARARAQVSAAEARLVLARSEQGRAGRLWADHAISQSDVESKENELKAAEANLEAARAAAQVANLNLSYTQVRAPVSGRVGRIEVTQGNLVGSGPSTQMLTTLVSISPIYASFDADEEVIRRTLEGLKAPNGGLKVEQVPVTLETGVAGDEPINGHLQLLDNQFDGSSGTLRARAVFSNADGRLIPGQFVRVRLGEAKQRSALLISELAVGTDQSKRFVYVVGSDHKVTYREVTLGAGNNGMRQVTSGLQPGERIIVNGLQHVRPGAVVKETEVAMTSATPQA